MMPSAQVHGAVHPERSKPRHVELQASWPGEAPRVSQISAPKWLASQTSPSSSSPLPHVSAGLSALFPHPAAAKISSPHRLISATSLLRYCMLIRVPNRFIHKDKVVARQLP